MRQRLNIAKIVFGAFMVPWWNWRCFVKALAIPLVVLTAVIQGWRYIWEQLPAWGNWLAWSIYGLVFVLCVVTTHRLALLNVPLIQIPYLPKWTWRETRFCLRMLAILLIYAVAAYLLLTFMVALSHRLIDATDENNFFWIQLVLKLPVLYLFARFSPIFPATAIDRNVSFKWAWEQTSGNGWRLVLIVASLPWIFSHTVGFLYRDEASVIEVLILRNCK